MSTGTNLVLNNDVEMPALGLRCLPDAAGADAVRSPGGTRCRLPAHRHRRGLRQRAPGRRSLPQLRNRPRRGLPRDQDLDQRLWLRPDAARLREERPQARRRPDRPAHPAPGPSFGRSTGPWRPTGPSRRCWLTEGPRHRRQQLHGRAPHCAARPRPMSSRRSTRSRCTPTSRRGRCRRSTPGTASSPRPGRPSAGSPSTATAATPARWRTQSSAASRGRTERRRRR